MRMTEAERAFYLHRPPPTRHDNSGMAYVTTAFVNHARTECTIMRALEAGPLSVSQLASRTGISRMTVHRRLSSLRMDKMVAVKPGNGCVPALWRLA